MSCPSKSADNSQGSEVTGSTSSEPVLPDQTKDDLEDRSERDEDDPQDLERFLRDVPPHHGA